VIWGVRETKYFRKNRKKDSTDKNHPASLICPSGQISEAFSSSLRGVHHPTLRATRSLTTASASRLKKILMEAPNTTTK
jgi:hypothetical protein